MGGEVNLVVSKEFSLVCACALQEFADSAFYVDLGSGFGVKVIWSLCTVDGVEYVLSGGVLSGCALS